MLFCDLTLETAAENVALDEALLDAAEASAGPHEVLRLWEPATPMVVMGRASRYDVEVQASACAAAGVPVIRRTSGGATIVSGPGCLMYALVLSLEARPELRSIDKAHQYVLVRLSDALQPIAPGIARHGTSDLAYDAAGQGGLKKFSGNSLRVKRRHLLYHGTLLYDFDLPLIGNLLAHPPREPDYRAGRPHGQFVANLPATTSAALRDALTNSWEPDDTLHAWPRERTAELVAAKYARAEWNVDGRSP